MTSPGDGSTSARLATAAAPDGFVGTLRRLLRGRRFRELFRVRVTSQFGDGVFQVALASYVLFSPEKQADAGGIAWALIAVLLPYSVLGPFAGVFLDRWDRRLILARFNLLRTVPVLTAAAVVAAGGGGVGLFAIVIVAFSLNRFLLAGLSASLPRVVERSELVMANAVTPTSGTISYMLGLGAGAGLRRLPWGFDHDVAVIVVAAAIYASAGLLALRIPRRQLGPDLDQLRPSLWREIGDVVRGLAAGLAHLAQRRQAGIALAVVAAHRFWYGLTLVATILLYRNTFHPHHGDAALAALSVAVLASAIGYFVAALLTPIATARLAPRGWILVLLVVAAVVEVVPAMLYTQPAIIASAFLLGVSAQGVKICVDTLVQTHTDDRFRGRVFAIYDVAFNLAFVSSAIVGAAVIPTSGKSYGVLGAAAVGYLLLAVAYAPLSRPIAAR